MDCWDLWLIGVPFIILAVIVLWDVLDASPICECGDSECGGGCWCPEDYGV